MIRVKYRIQNGVCIMFLLSQQYYTARKVSTFSSNINVTLILDLSANERLHLFFSVDIFCDIKKLLLCFKEQLHYFYGVLALLT